MRLRDWSGRRVARMWLVAAALEVLVISAWAILPLLSHAERERTSDVQAILIPQTGTPPAVFPKTNRRADSLRDSLRALVGLVFTDSLVRTLANGLGGAVRRLIVLAAVVLLPVPVTASAITTRWWWLRRRPTDAPPHE
jgi:hypothetical protein